MYKLLHLFACIAGDRYGRVRDASWPGGYRAETSLQFYVECQRLARRHCPSGNVVFGREGTMHRTHLFFTAGMLDLIGQCGARGSNAQINPHRTRMRSILPNGIMSRRGFKLGTAQARSRRFEFWATVGHPAHLAALGEFRHEQHR